MSKQTQPVISIDLIDERLPQTQCTQCGYPSCRAYAEAIARGKADINQCPPGDNVTIQGLAILLHTTPKPLNPHFGLHKSRQRAVIDETRCIGCRKCLEACPVDAILGASKLMHTVIAQECSGCELCISPCPVNCITMVPVGAPPASEPWPEFSLAEANHWRARTGHRLERLARRRHTRSMPTPGEILPSSAEAVQPLSNDRERIRGEIRAAVERATKKRQSAGTNTR
ncbi:MAG: RnfABCDGE type electron transport complex subunit B [Sulfuricaulis sp.]